jgi:hypothetical protein
MFYHTHVSVNFVSDSNINTSKSNCHVMWVPCHYSMARPQVADGGDGLQIWRVAAIILNKKSLTVEREWLCRLECWPGADNPHCKYCTCYLIFKRASLRTEISYNILFELWIPLKLATLIKTCLNETAIESVKVKISPESFLFRMAWN